LLKKLTDSITPEIKKEWEENEMRLSIEKDYMSHPDAKGYEDKK
jgi:ppGpp synthetase/RelA/SpoT-type nucleotidyltranferase